MTFRELIKGNTYYAFDYMKCKINLCVVVGKYIFPHKHVLVRTLDDNENRVFIVTDYNLLQPNLNDIWKHAVKRIKQRNENNRIVHEYQKQGRIYRWYLDR